MLKTLSWFMKYHEFHLATSGVSKPTKKIRPKHVSIIEKNLSNLLRAGPIIAKLW